MPRSVTMSRWSMLIVLGLKGSSMLYAQASDPELTLQEARSIALKNHPQVLASEANYHREDQLTREARSAYYPTLNGDITGAQANMDSRLGAGAINDPRLFNHFGTGLTLSQLITDSGRTHNLVANAQLGAQAGREDYRATQYNIVLGADQAYYEVLLSQQLVKVAQQTVDTRQSVADQVGELTKNKLRSDVDLSFANVNLADAKIMLLNAQDRLQTAYAGLAQALGTQKYTEYKLVDQPQPAEVSKDIDSLVKQAFQNRPELASARLQIEADQKFVYAERDLKRPTVSLMAVGGVLPYINPGNANPSIPLEYEAAGVNVNIPIFNGHLFSARREAAEYQLKATEQRSRDLEDRITRDVRAAWARAKTTYETIGATEQLLKQANMALDLAQGRYKLGLASIVELNQAQLGQTSAQVQNLNAKYSYEDAYEALQYTLGLLH